MLRLESSFSTPFLISQQLHVQLVLRKHVHGFALHLSLQNPIIGQTGVEALLYYIQKLKTKIVNVYI